MDRGYQKKVFCKTENESDDTTTDRESDFITFRDFDFCDRCDSRLTTDRNLEVAMGKNWEFRVLSD